MRRARKRRVAPLRREEALIKETFDSDEARQRGLSAREYQINAARQIVDALEQNRSSELVLPTGTGKTMIANLASFLARSRGRKGRGLYVVPRRVLAQQHTWFASWMWPRLRPLLIDQHRAADPFRLAALAHESDILIGTPELLANAVRSARLPRDITNSIEYLVADEYDAFLISEYDTSGPIARFEEGFASLRDALPANLPAVLISATSPGAQLALGSRNPTISVLAEFVKKSFAPLPVEIDVADYAGFIPRARVHPILVSDSILPALDEAIKTQFMQAFDQLSFALRGEPDTQFVLTRLEGILTGRVRNIPVFRGAVHAMPRVTPDALRICGEIRAALSRFEFLFEDMFAGYEVEWRRIKRVHWPDKVEFRERWIFAASPAHGHYHPELRAKADAVIALCKAKGVKRAVIFVRFVRLAEAVHQRLVKEGLSAVLLHGELDDQARKLALEQFRDKKEMLLVITRDSGRRGLDLPQADYALFYSPKSSEPVSWQEMSRIRSTVAHLKDSYFLVYDGTGEVDKMNRLLEEMEFAGREYKLLPSATPPSVPMSSVEPGPRPRHGARRR